MLTRRVQAAAFATSLGEKVADEAWVRDMRANSGNEHKVLSGRIQAHLAEFLAPPPTSKAAPPTSFFDWEGNSARTWPQAHSYTLLGTGAHPDAAVLQPFTCALEFDRQPPTKGTSYLKDRVMKAACHVLSGAYDAVLVVYILDPVGAGRDAYLDKGNPFTDHLLATLKLQGLELVTVV